MNKVNGWTIATALNGDKIRVKIVPLQMSQNSREGTILVEVGKEIQLESGENRRFNIDGHSFYLGMNQLYRVSI
ncbi:MULTISPECIES: transposase [Acinetobacter]|uniref:transposase n=1 Tax=Acinetobacter TaxID=469 RepID=UPI00257753B1|nr:MULTISPECIES: transposase [Acinetobacter]MDM1765688.1 transposase [Acinetobacter sp. 226-1]MDM1769425.1 transposase [Acinetobacter sp. 226-4]MDQ9023141.1 transposase [Acinetobacter sichuanensis]